MIDINEGVHYLYWEKNINCAKTMITCLSEIYGIGIKQQVVDSAIGLAGAGQFRAQCGLVEGGLMFIGIFFTGINKTEQEIRKICHDYAEEFQHKFSSLRCYDIRPTGFVSSNPPHLCEKITCRAVEFAYQFIEGKLQ
ncbi:C-GCAxxG-C-C family protein [uncultured Clostridium sp.]|jgi:C_GCAxxG_C_C family probable redox protein|uniref:C-GCAxxG-C-C family protein n=1 Tax=uncultured Clostridium sp. TaxID=59620 RepID=UPI0025D2790B|nr:C-GCAxxG-C-C family protein [uncultured Clostridium sp.]